MIGPNTQPHSGSTLWTGNTATLPSAAPLFSCVPADNHLLLPDIHLPRPLTPNYLSAIHTCSIAHPPLDPSDHSQSSYQPLLQDTCLSHHPSAEWHFPAISASRLCKRSEASLTLGNISNNSTTTKNNLLPKGQPARHTTTAGPLTTAHLTHTITNMTASKVCRSPLPVTPCWQPACLLACLPTCLYLHF